MFFHFRLNLWRLFSANVSIKHQTGFINLCIWVHKKYPLPNPLPTICKNEQWICCLSTIKSWLYLLKTWESPCTQIFTTSVSSMWMWYAFNTVTLTKLYTQKKIGCGTAVLMFCLIYVTLWISITLCNMLKGIVI